MKKSMLFPMLGLSMTSFVPLSFAVSCGNSPHGGIYYGVDYKKPLPKINVETEVPNKMFAATQNSALYDKLKNSPFVITKSGNGYVYVKNDYVKFCFSKEFIDALITKHNYSIEEYSRLIFQQMNLSPAIEFMNDDYQFLFSITGDKSTFVSFHDGKLGQTSYETDSAILITPDNSDPTTSAQTEVHYLGFICNVEYFQFEQNGIYSKTWPTSTELPNGLKQKFDRVVFNNISKELSDKGFKIKTYDELFPKSETRILPAYQDALNTDYSFLQQWNSDNNLNELATLLVDFINTKTSNYSYAGHAFASDLDAMIELLKRLYRTYCANFLVYKNGLVRRFDLEDLMPHEIAQVFNFNFFDNAKPREAFDVMSVLLNNIMNLGANDNACIYLTQDTNNKLKIDKINYKSFANDFTENADKLQVFDVKTNKVLHEYQINHKNYPIGFNRNPFTEYEYKYVAPGAYLVDNSINWDIGDHNLEDIRLKVITKNGQELPQEKIFVNAKIFEKSDENLNTFDAAFNHEYTHCKYLNELYEWKDVEDFYK